MQILHLYFAGHIALLIASFIACLIACLSYFCCYIPTKVGVRQHFCDTPSAYILRSYQLYFNSLRRTKASILSQKSIIFPTEISHIISREPSFYTFRGGLSHRFGSKRMLLFQHVIVSLMLLIQLFAPT